MTSHEPPSSFEIMLTERYMERLDHANIERHDCKVALSRIALIYSGQLHFEYPDIDHQTTFSYPEGAA